VKQYLKEGVIKIGVYINSMTPSTLYQKTVNSPYFVDKSNLLLELISLINTDMNYVCITRPRRFGKTVMANMIASYLGKYQDGNTIFDQLSISREKPYQKHLNQHNVIYITLNEVPEDCATYLQYRNHITARLKNDIRKMYPNFSFKENDAIWDILRDLFAEYSEQFVFIFDEWDFIFHQRFMTLDDKISFLVFMRSLLKDRPYVSLAYMTGILPISKYSSGSELNMFIEYSMITEKRFSTYFGFSEHEVDLLYERYCGCTKDAKITRTGLRDWYNGYYIATGERVYNPRSVVAALTNDNLNSYWTSSGPYDEIYYYVKNNIADVRGALAVMISGESVASKVREYAVVSMSLNTKEEIFSAMVVYGFLSYKDGMLSIPNQELMYKFEEMLQTEHSLGYIYRLAKASEQMLAATLAGNTKTMSQILSYAHDTETPILNYNHETELSAIVNLVYLSARDQYRIEREDKTGRGFVDFIFYPHRTSDDCIILEIKVDHSADEAICQIKTRKYFLRFQGKLGEQPHYTGRIVLVGIGYYKLDKRHECKVEYLETPSF
jgi:hypothetical protein